MNEKTENMEERKEVERELSLLIGKTLYLEDELNNICKVEEN